MILELRNKLIGQIKMLQNIYKSSLYFADLSAWHRCICLVCEVIDLKKQDFIRHKAVKSGCIHQHQDVHHSTLLSHHTAEPFVGTFYFGPSALSTESPWNSWTYFYHITITHIWTVLSLVFWPVPGRNATASGPTEGLRAFPMVRLFSPSSRAHNPC